MEVLTIEQLSYSYDGKTNILKNLKLQFETGKIYGIVGKSGAGKSTLLSLLAGLERYHEGSIRYQGQELATLNYDHYRAKDIGIIFQGYNLLPQLTALENVLLAINISNHRAIDKKEKAFQLLKKVGIENTTAYRRVLQLSGGEQQRVSIARALSSDANIIFADEPTGNLDKETEEDILNLLLSLAHKENKCVIIISHSQKVKELADIIYELKDGKIKKGLLNYNLQKG